VKSNSKIQSERKERSIMDFRCRERIPEKKKRDPLSQWKSIKECSTAKLKKGHPVRGDRKLLRCRRTRMEKEAVNKNSCQVGNE